MAVVAWLTNQWLNFACWLVPAISAIHIIILLLPAPSLQVKSPMSRVGLFAVDSPVKSPLASRPWPVIKNEKNDPIRANGRSTDRLDVGEPKRGIKYSSNPKPPPCCNDSIPQCQPTISLETDNTSSRCHRLPGGLWVSN